MGFILNHAFQVQQTGYWCGPAAARIALSVRNVFPSQQELADKLGTDVNGTDSSNDIVRVMNEYLGAGVYEATFIPGSDATAAELEEFRRDLKNSLDNGYAVVANGRGTIHTNEGWTYSYPGGHYLALTGYDDSDNVFVSDNAVREYWTTIPAMATWIAERGYSSSTVTAPVPPTPAGPPSWPAWVPAGEYFGLITGPAESHGGIDARERDAVLLIQKRLQELGFAPGGSGWADGKFEQATADAVSAWQHVAMPGTKFYGQVWSDDWAVLFAPPVTPPVTEPPVVEPPVAMGDTFLIVDLASPYQDGADLAGLKAAGVQAVNIKTTEGTGYINPRAVQWGNEARANGLEISTFHWIDSSGTGAAQAEKAFSVMKLVGGGSVEGMAHSCDCEDDADLTTVTDYIVTMTKLLGRPIAFYTGDWWLDDPSRKWDINSLTPYLWAAPNDGYLSAYPGDDSPQWHAGYGGYSGLSAMQFSVGPLSGAPSNVSKTMMRKGVWAELTKASVPTPSGLYVAAIVAALRPFLLTKEDVAAVVRAEIDKTKFGS